MRKNWMARALPALALLATTTGCDGLGEILEDRLSAEVTNFALEVDPATGTLTDKAVPDLPSLLTEAEVLPDGRLAFIGHLDPSDLNHQEEVLLYDPATNAWSEGAVWPSPRRRVSWVTLDGKLCGGSGFVNEPGEDDVPVDRLDCYDAAANTWSELATPTVRASESVVIDGKLYAFDGSRGYEPSTATTDAAMYDPASDMWTPIADKPVCKVSQAVAVNGEAHIFGCGQSSDETASYDPATDTWSPTRDGAPALRGLRDPRATVIGSTIYFDAPDLVAHDTTTQTARVLVPPTDHSIRSAAEGSDGKLVVITGKADDTLYVYIVDPADDSWTAGDTFPAGELGGSVEVVHSGGRVFLFVTQTDSITFQ